MSNFSDDIIKYKMGLLAPKEMHALEKKALSDPFLADALEGAEKISSKEFLNDLQFIHEKIKPKKKTFFFSPLRIAAGILVVAVASFIVYQLIPKTERLALQTKKEKPKPAIDSLKAAASTKPVEQQASQSPKPKTDSKPITSQQSHSIAKSKEKGPTETETPTLAKTKPVEQNSLAQVSKQPATITLDKPTEISGEVARGIQPSIDKKADDLAEVAPKQVMARKKDTNQLRATGAGQLANQVITGQVLSSTDGLPMPGVNVMLKGTTEGTVTDESGFFKLNLNQPNQSLVFSFIGFESQEISAGDKNKLDVNLKEDATQLSEIVVTGYGAPKDPNAEPIIKLAEPVGGRKLYDKYLDDNLQYPQQALENKVKGRVVIEFTVRTDGSLDEFNVVKKLGYGCDEEVIRLVKEGPAWKPTTQNNVAVESNVRVRMKFNPDGKK